MRGIGVAVKASTCTFERNDLIFSFCETPKCCSSSIISIPNFLNLILLLRSACVPTTTSLSPLLILSIILLFSEVEFNLEI